MSQSTKKTNLKKIKISFLFNNSIKGFTLLEMIIVVFVILVGLTGASSLITQTLSATANYSSKLIAAYLGQEGIEIVRNIRDGNWLEQRTATTTPWKDGLSNGDWEIDYNDSQLTPYTGRTLKVGYDGFYNYETGTATSFKRKITITPSGDDILKISVQVQWEEKGISRQMIVQGNLYKWR